MFLEGERSSVLLEVNITVLNNKVCETNYMFLPDFLQRWPRGFIDDVILCAGELDQNKDACQVIMFI